MSDRVKLRAAAIELITDALSYGDMIRIRAQGGSMVPSIWPGDILTIRPILHHWPQIDEVALMRSENGLRAHRVVGHRTVGGLATIITRGDALECDDAMVEPNAILGTVVYRNGAVLKSRRSGWRRLFERTLLRLQLVQTLALKVNAFRKRYSLPASINQFA